MPLFKILVQVAVLGLAYYYIFAFLRGTRGAQVLVGLVMALVVLLGVTYLFKLDTLNWILRQFSVFLGMALLVIFQPEIRRALAELGRQPVFTASRDRRTVIDHVVQAVEDLAEHKIGALVAFEREIGTGSVQETGVKLEAKVVPELLASIFYPHTPLHDGGVIISGNLIKAAGCVFPLSQDTEHHAALGTRHRAAVGLSEETDAVVVVVSEETGTISVSYRGRLSRGLDGKRLKRFLAALLLKDRASESPLRRAQEQLDLTPEGIAKSEQLAEKKEDGSAA
jgi:diadenylate cyclase